MAEELSKDVSSGLIEKLGGFAGKWSGFTALGSFVIYLLGYLTLRFQLSTYGVATNLDLLDEKYFFAGCRFLVYLVSSVPNTLIIVLLLAAIGCVPYALTPASIRHRIGEWAAGWAARPLQLPLLGTILAIAMIQFVLRRCFALGNVLLQKQLPDEWISSVLLSNDGRLSLYFSGLVAGAVLTGSIFWYVSRRGSATTTMAKLFFAVLGFLVAVEFLLLPVNYGVLISTQLLPRVSELGGDEKVLDGERGWLVWDSKDAFTYFIIGPGDKRTLLTTPRKEGKVKIVAYDDIYCVLFSADHTNSRPCAR
jgi:hypothetical protein